MDSSIWIWIGIVAVVVWGWIIWDFVNTPITPADYTNQPKPKPEQPPEPEHPPR